MEIHLLLEGEQVGPLSEEQVRQYLNDGLISTDDLASYEGMADWMPLERVLDHFRQISPAPEAAPGAEPAAESPAPVAASSEPGETPFVIHKDSAESPESPAEHPLRQKTASLTATQRTKRKLNKIVIQPILPLETTLPVKKKSKTGKTTVNLEALRPTTALPAVTSHPPKEKKLPKGAIQTGQLSFQDFAEKPVAAAPPPLVAEPAPAPAPAQAQVEPVVTPPVLPAPSPVPETPTAPAAPTAPPIRTVSLAPAVAVEVLPAPVERLSTHWKKPEGRRTSSGLFPRMPSWAFYGGVVFVLLIIGVLLACIYLMVAHEKTPDTATPETSANTAPAPAPTILPAPPAEPTTAADFSDRGFQRQAKGDLDGAIADYDHALTIDPKAVEVFYRRGLARQAKGDMAGAMDDYTQVIALNPKNENAYSNRAYIKQSQGDLDGALADYAQALLINPNVTAAYNNMGLIKVKKGDLDGAIAAYNRALEIDPKMAFAYYNRGVAKNTEGNIDGAIADYTQALALNPNIAIAYCDRGAARQSKGDNDGALADYTQALSLDPKLVDAFYNRGLIKLQKGDFDGAVGDNTQAVALDPKYGQAYYHRGLAFFGQGNLDDARLDLKQFCALLPRDPAVDAARNYIWVISKQQNATGDADAELSRAVLNDWNSPPEDLTSKIAAFLLGHISESDLIANAASPDPSREPGQYCRVWYFAGMKRLLGGDTATAASYFQKSMATGQKDFYEYAFSQTELQALGKNTEVASKPAPGT